MSDVILTLDPSSSITGWAAFDPAGTPAAFGTIRPRAVGAIHRIDEMARRAARLVEKHAPAWVLIEWAGFAQGGGARRGGGSGLTTLGQAQGAIRQALRPVAVVRTINQDVWTGVAPKDKRAELVRTLVPAYRDYADRGLDVADALGIGLWYFELARQAELLHRAGAAGPPDPDTLIKEATCQTSIFRPLASRTGGRPRRRAPRRSRSR